MFKGKRGRIFSGALSLAALSTIGLSAGMSAAPAAAATPLVMGADVSWLHQMEDEGVVWQDPNGNPNSNALQILKNNGMTAVRLRAWVNPSGGYSGTSDVLYMAKRAQAMGLSVMIDFHYSDTWADPGKQYKPTAWQNDSFSQLKTDVYNYTYGVMKGLADEGVYPKWVQVGNEIRNGMLWPDGKVPNFANLAQLINSGYDAVKAVSSSSKVVIHLDKGEDNSEYRYFFDNLKANGGKFDVIGMSYYPYWENTDYTTTIAGLGNNLNDMATRYGKDVVIAEIGGEENLPTDTYNMMKAVESKLQAVPNGHGIGLFYWEPESNSSVNGYNLGATSEVSSNVLRFTKVITAFGGSSGGGGSGYVRIQNHATGLYIDGEGRTSNGSNAGQWSSSTSSNQQWQIVPDGSYVRLENRATGLYLEGEGRTSNGSAVGQWSDSTSNNQQWTETTDGSYVRFQNRATGLFIDGEGRTANGSDLGQWSNSTSNHQQWQIVPE